MHPYILTFNGLAMLFQLTVLGILGGAGDPATPLVEGVGETVAGRWRCMRGMVVPIAVVHRPKQINAVRKLAQVKMYFTSKNVKQKSML